MMGKGIKEIQSKRLVELVDRMYNNAVYYRKKMDEQGIKPSDIHGIEDLERLPFTTIDDLRGNNLEMLLAVEKRKIVCYHSLVGGIAPEHFVGYTTKDIEIWTECVVRSMQMAGFDENDIIQIAHEYGLAAGGLDAHYVAERIGAAIVPAPLYSRARAVSLMEQLNVTGIMCTPSYLLRITQTIEEQGARDRLKLRTAVCGGEPLSDKFRGELENRLKIRIYNTYGIKELEGLELACECECHNGMHINEDCFITEICEGELVVTTLESESMPLIRYKTNDLASITYQECECGRTTARLSDIAEKETLCFMLRGRTIFASQLESALKSLDSIDAVCRIRIGCVKGLDTIDVQIESGNMEMYNDRAAVHKIVSDALRKETGIVASVSIVDKGVLTGSLDKKVTIMDMR